MGVLDLRVEVEQSQPVCAGVPLGFQARAHRVDLGALARHVTPAAHEALDLLPPRRPAPWSQAAHEGVDRCPAVARQPDLDGVAVRDDGRIRVDLHGARLPGRRIELRPRVVGTDDEQRVAALQHSGGSRCAQVAHHSRREGMRFIDIGLAEQARRDAGAEVVGETENRVFGTANPATGEDRDALAGFEDLHRRAQILLARHELPRRPPRRGHDLAVRLSEVGSGFRLHAVGEDDDRGMALRQCGTKRAAKSTEQRVVAVASVSVDPLGSPGAQPFDDEICDLLVGSARRPVGARVGLVVLVARVHALSCRGTSSRATFTAGGVTRQGGDITRTVP